MTKNIDHIEELVSRLAGEEGISLAVFSEFSLQGYAGGRSVSEWVEASIQIPGPETDALAKVAVANNCFIVACAYEVIAGFPGRYFNTGFVIDSDGELVLTYRKLYAMTSKTRPGDILDQWLDRFGSESLFPVAETGLGRIGCLIARDIHWPETARCLTLKGAELIVNPTGSGALKPSAVTNYIRRVRAGENMVYLAMGNIGQFSGGGEDLSSSRMPAEIVDFDGNVLDQTDGSDDSAATATVDIEALRAARLMPGRNYIAQLQPALHTPIYASDELFGVNGWKDAPIVGAEDNLAREQATLQRMVELGLLTSPASEHQ